MAKKKAANVFVWIIMALLIAGLAGFGATNFGGSVRSVATVGDTEVDVNDYARALEAQMRNFQRTTGQQITFAQARAFGIDSAALSQLVSSAALENEASVLGLSVGDENVSREIMGSPTFRGLSGNFERETYEFTLRQNGIDVRDYEERVRGETASGILRAAVSAGVATPDLFVDTLFNFARETRDVTWARLGADDLEAPLSEPSDDDLRAYYDANPEPFTQAETRVIDYAWLSPDMIVGSIEVAEDQVRALYDGRIDEYVQPERRLVERLVFATDAEAADAGARLDAGNATFDDLIEARGLTLDDVDMGEVAAADLGEAADAIFALEEPDVVGPLPSLLGPALYRMNGILAAQDTPFEDVRDELAAEAAADRARRIITESIAQIEDLLAGGADVAMLAERTDMQADRIEWRDDISEGIAAYDAFRAAAAAAEPGAFPEVVELDDGGIVVVALDEIVPPTLKPFEDVRAEVVQAWVAQQTQSALEIQANALAERLRNGSEMAALGLSLETDRALGRDGFVEGTPPDFTDIVFDMETDEVRVLAEGGEAWLVRIDRIQVPDPTTPDSQAVRAQFALQTAEAISNSLLTAYTQSVLDNTGVTINQSAINAVQAQLP